MAFVFIETDLVLIVTVFVLNFRSTLAETSTWTYWILVRCIFDLVIYMLPAAGSLFEQREIYKN